jgi:phosphate-selective porin OprO and OprP
MNQEWTRGLRRTLALTVAAGLFASAAIAEALFYREAEKDGRVFAFASAAAFDAWEGSGALDHPVELAGVGPHGETVVCDSEAAVALYRSMHALPAEPQRQEKPDASKTKLYWKDGRTTLETDNAEISLSNRVQFRFTDQFPEAPFQLPGTENAGDSKGSFRVRRAKTRLEGWFWRKELTFDFSLAWAGPDPGVSQGTPLEDMRLSYDFSGHGAFRVSVGQFKVPFGRQEMTSSGRLQMADRDILSADITGPFSGDFTHGRDTGIDVEGLVANDRVEYGAGVFNGNARNALENDNAKFQYDAHLTFQPFGNVAYSEGDFETKDKPLLAVGVEFENNNLHGATNADDFDTTIWGGYAVFKFKGASLFGEYFARNRTPELGASFDSNGYHVQAGYFLKRDVVEVAFRYATWDPSSAFPGDDQSEVGGVLNYYVKKHNLKFQADYRSLEDKGSATKIKELRIQTQVVF